MSRICSTQKYPSSTSCVAFKVWKMPNIFQWCAFILFLCETPAVTNSDNFDVSSQPSQISLVIVFDASSSSSSSLTTVNTFQQRQHYAELIVNQFSSRKYKLIYNYVLLPVRQNDNTERAALVTSDKHELLVALNQLPKYDDEICSQCVINGILAALRNARPNSYVYTFTDAIANDCESQDEIINLIKQKQATV